MEMTFLRKKKENVVVDDVKVFLLKKSEIYTDTTELGVGRK